MGLIGCLHMQHNLSQRKCMHGLGIWLFYTCKPYLIKLCLVVQILLHVVTFMLLRPNISSRGMRDALVLCVHGFVQTCII